MRLVSEAEDLFVLHNKQFHNFTLGNTPTKQAEVWTTS